MDNYKRMRIFSKWPKMCLIADTCLPCHKFADVKVSYVLSLVLVRGLGAGLPT